MVICKSSFFAIFFIAIQAINTPAIACFDDVKLDNLIRSQPNSLLYVWSPRMALSATQAHLAADAAKAVGLRFVPLADGRLPAVEWQSALRTLATLQPLDAEALAMTEPLCSPQLLEKDAYAHFPTSFVVSNGDMHPNRLIGAMPANFWVQGIQERLKRGNDTFDVKAPQQCIPQNQFIALDPALAGVNDDNQVALGAYERISPDGRYVLRSFSGKNLSAVSLVELPGPPGLTSISGQVSRQKIYSTPFSNEAFPVQGSWRYLVDTNGDHYTFNSILSNKYAGYSHNSSSIKPLFSGGMTGFYAAASEVGGGYPLRDSQGDTQLVVIRSLSWPNANASGSATENRQGEGMLTARTITVDAQKQRVVADSSRVNLCLNRLGEDGAMYALPMISVDGLEFAALPQNPVAGVPTMRIFGFGADGKQCEPSGQFTLQSGKVIFGFSNKTKKHADLAYEYRGQVWWVQRDNSIQTLPPLNLAPWEDPAAAAKASKADPAYKDVTASAFPGFSRDGRVVYAATWKRCDGALERDCVQEGGYVVSDPYQSNAFRNQLLQSKVAAPKKCITVQDVAAERSAFAAFHSISN
ncbi:MAG: hypothetical protein RL761_381 [Pseudomonadota bacterium]|jgi:hypothetical protein